MVSSICYITEVFAILNVILHEVNSSFLSLILAYDIICDVVNFHFSYNFLITFYFYLGSLPAAVQD